MPILHDGDVTMTQMPRWTLNYEWWDGTAEIGGWDISDQLFDKLFRWRTWMIPGTGYEMKGSCDATAIRKSMDRFIEVKNL
jgi:hypothetical protein